MSISQNILVPIDCLIDTRYGLAVNHFPDGVRDLDHEAYRTRRTHRVWEHFGADEKEWNINWKERDVNVLMSSAPTELMFALKTIVSNAVVRGETTPIYDSVNIYIDVHPYRLNKAEIQAIEESVKELLLNDVNIEVVSHGIARLSPKNLKERYDVVFMYEFIEWLTQHNEELGANPIPRVVMNYPAVFTDDNPDLMEQADRENTNPFHATKAAMADFLTVDALDINLFSLPQLPHP